MVRAYSEPGALRADMAYFRAFAENARQNAGYGDHKLAMPVLALGGASGNGMVPLQQMRLTAIDAQGGVIKNAVTTIADRAASEVADRRLMAFFREGLARARRNERHGTWAGLHRLGSLP